MCLKSKYLLYYLQYKHIPYELLKALTCLFDATENYLLPFGQFLKIKTCLIYQITHLHLTSVYCKKD